MEFLLVPKFRGQVTVRATHFSEVLLKLESPAPCCTHNLGELTQPVIRHHVKEPVHATGSKLNKVQSTSLTSDALSGNFQPLVADAR